MYDRCWTFFMFYFGVDFWSIFGSILKSETSFGGTFRRCCNIFGLSWRKLASRCAPRPPKSNVHQILAPTWPPYRGYQHYGFGAFSALGAFLGARWPQERFQRRFGTDFANLLVDFLSIFGALAGVSSCVKARAQCWIRSAISFQKLVRCPFKCFINSITESLHRGTVAEMARRAAG